MLPCKLPRHRQKQTASRPTGAGRPVGSEATWVYGWMFSIHEMGDNTSEFDPYFGEEPSINQLFDG